MMLTHALITNVGAVADECSGWLVAAIEARWGIRAVVCDVNDLSKQDAKGGRLALLHASEGVRTEAGGAEWVRRALLPNPAGNGDQRTPLVLLRRTP